MTISTKTEYIHIQDSPKDRLQLRHNFEQTVCTQFVCL